MSSCVGGVAVIGSCEKGRHVEGLLCCGDSLSHCVENLWSEGSTKGLACRQFSSSVCNLSRVNQRQICCAFVEVVHL